MILLTNWLVCEVSAWMAALSWTLEVPAETPTFVEKFCTVAETEDRFLTIWFAVLTRLVTSEEDLLPVPATADCTALWILATVAVRLGIALVMASISLCVATPALVPVPLTVTLELPATEACRTTDFAARSLRIALTDDSNELEAPAATLVAEALT